MATAESCPRCGAPLPGDAPEGLCPHCLLKLALADVVDSLAWEEPGETAAGSESFQPPAVADLADKFSQFEILELIGQGGMGAVYKARQKGLDRVVALKILRPDLARDGSFAERFSREAKALAQLNHPHIVTVHDVGQQDGLYFLVMEYVEGLTLRQLIRCGELPPAEALALVPQVCDALQYAHDEGVVHRDIKPENVLVDRRGRVKIADFGLAKLLRRAPAEVTLTQMQQVMGTLHYMAPEQMERPLEVDHRADIYSLGVVLYEMLTGKLPLGRFPLPSESARVDVRLDEVVLRALEREPSRRYQHASDVKSQVESISRGGNAHERRDDAPDADSAGRAPWNRVGGSETSGSGAMPKLLAVAFAVTLGLLICVAGVAMIVGGSYASEIGSGPWWGFFGGGLGCLLGGLGALVGAWNSYRQLEGRRNLTEEPGWTPVDFGMFLLGVLGALGLVAGLVVAGRNGWWSGYPFLLLGGILSFQASLFLGFRALMRRSHRQLQSRQAHLPVVAETPADDGHRRRALAEVRRPGIGLVIVGIFTWIVLALSVPFLLPMLMMRMPDDAAAMPSERLLAPAILVFLMVVAGTFIFAGLKMVRLEMYPLCLVAAVLAMIVSPANLIGLPIGIWALVVLTRRETRRAFRAGRQRLAA